MPWTASTYIASKNFSLIGDIFACRILAHILVMILKTSIPLPNCLLHWNVYSFLPHLFLPNSLDFYLITCNAHCCVASISRVFQQTSPVNETNHIIFFVDATRRDYCANWIVVSDRRVTCETRLKFIENLFAFVGIRNVIAAVRAKIICEQRQTVANDSTRKMPKVPTAFDTALYSSRFPLTNVALIQLELF